MPDESVQHIDITDHDCGDPDCSNMRLFIFGSEMAEVDGQLVPCITMSPESAFDLISMLSQALKGKILIIEGD
jgi:hypothetical protein